MHLAPQTGLCKHTPSSARCQHPRINVSRQEGSVPGFPVTSDPWRLQGGTPLQKLARVQGGREAPTCGAAASAKCRKGDGVLRASLEAGQSPVTWAG